MTITFNELRRIKDRLPEGSVQHIAEQLGVEIDTVRNYFGGDHFEGGQTVGIHYEPGPDGGIVHIDDDSILNMAMELIGSHPN